MCSVFTAEGGGSLDVESDGYTASARAVAAARAGARDSDVVRTPTSVGLAVDRDFADEAMGRDIGESAERSKNGEVLHVRREIGA